MIRFLLSTDAEHDLDEIKIYLDQLPADPAFRIASELQSMIEEIARHPLRGAVENQMTRMLGQEVRSRLCGPYRVLYRPGQPVSILGFLHTSRNILGTMSARLQ